jgi:RimJ/RimL family protein N-acetyltransferase
MIAKIKLEKYRWNHAIWFFFGLLNFEILKSAGVFQKKFITKFMKSLISETKEKLWKFTIISDGTIIGGLDIVETSDGVFNIGIIIFKKYWGMGFGAGAMKKAFVKAKSLGAKKIVCTSYLYNKESIGLAKKLKFKKIRETKEEIIWEKIL